MRHSEPINESFKAWKNGNPYKHNPWHYHPEYEITYIFNGKGLLFIGDKMINYGKDELFMLGPNLPHEFRSNVSKNPDLFSRSISIHFKNDFLGRDFNELPEATVIKDLFAKSKPGIRINDTQVKMRFKKQAEELLEMKGIQRIYKILELFHILSGSAKWAFLSSNAFVDSIDQSQDHRINQVYEFVMKNFTGPIKVTDVASIINMTPTSFCRFFRNRTNKPFLRYLTEVRIGYACRLLLEDKLSIAQVAYTSGFGNLSHFNKQFLNIKDVTPSQFLNHYRRTHDKTGQ